MTEELRSILLGTAGLSLAGIAALFLTLARGGVTADRAGLHRTVRLAFPLLPMRTADYFPGLVTSPLAGIMGVVLARRLALVTGGQRGERGTL